MPTIVGILIKQEKLVIFQRVAEISCSAELSMKKELELSAKKVLELGGLLSIYSSER